MRLSEGIGAPSANVRMAIPSDAAPRQGRSSEMSDPSQPAPRASSDPAGRLERVEAVTDASLAHLSLDELLKELLTRMTDLLAADTAAILLLDESTGTL